VASLADVGEAIAIPADLSKAAECDRLAAEVTEREGGRLDILVNNAGANWGAPFAEFPDSAWDRVLDVNVKGVFHLTRALAPALTAAGSARNPSRVVNIGSIDGIRVPEMDTYSYSASKAAVHHLTKTLARRLGPDHITVNAIAPGPFESKMMAATLDAFRDHIEAASPFGRIGEPDDIAGAAIYLCSRAASWVTGVILPVDGGMATTK
jgi:NAD(P)-dependent dehydrogenase (short-subunit alcohol dehydrogenase family)